MKTWSIRTASSTLCCCWNLADYMEESLVKPTIDRLWSVMKPGGLLLAFFHTRDAGPDSTCYRYHVTGTDMLEMQEVKFAIPGTIFLGEAVSAAAAGL